jgi:hypothetical protein
MFISIHAMFNSLEILRCSYVFLRAVRYSLSGRQAPVGDSIPLPMPFFASAKSSWREQARVRYSLPGAHNFHATTLQLSNPPISRPWLPMDSIDQDDVNKRLESQDITIKYDAKRNPCCGHCWQPRTNGHTDPLSCNQPCGTCGQLDHNGFVKRSSCLSSSYVR